MLTKKLYGDIMALEIIGRLGKRMKNVIKAITKAEADACRARCRRENVFVAELDGKGIKTQADLFRKTARAFKLPKRAVCADWDSFAVCLRDLSWLVCDKGFAGVSLFIYNFDELLCGSAFDKEVFTEMLRDVILPYWEGDPADNGNGAPRRFDMFMIGNSFIEEIEKALRYKEGWNEDELKNTADIFVKSGCGKKDWDWDSGEDICFLESNDGKTKAAIHSKFPIAFAEGDFHKYDRKAGRVFSEKIHIVKVQDFNKPIWFVDLARLKELAPEITWVSGPEDLDVSAFSVLDYVYAVNN